MCEHEVEYIEFPTRIIGGPSGNYFIQCNTTSCRWAEYIVTGISNGAAAASTVVINASAPMTASNALNYVGQVTLNDGALANGNSYSVLASTTIPAPMLFWERITNSEKKVFLRIDAGNSNACYVNIRFRVAVLKTVPGPAVTGDPHDMQSLNEARADAVRQRLGLEKELSEEESIAVRRERTTRGRK